MTQQNDDFLSEEQRYEIDMARLRIRGTCRSTNAALEELMYVAYPVLAPGFIRLIDYMGDESAIVQAARVSYGSGTKHTSEDAGLLRYLLRHRHTTPFEMAEIKFHVKLPIFVARQWIRHRTASVNEYSARYSILDKEFYIPDPEHMQTQSKDNKQGRGDDLTPQQTSAVQQLLRDDANRCYNGYQILLNESHHQTLHSLGEDDPECIASPSDRLVDDPTFFGLARELARMNLTLNTYTQWYWKVNVHNLMHFLGLRCDSHAQYEIRVYADRMAEILHQWMPNVHQAFLDYKLNAFNLSGPMITALRNLLRHTAPQDLGVALAAAGLGKREAAELLLLLQPPT